MLRARFQNGAMLSRVLNHRLDHVCALPRLLQYPNAGYAFAGRPGSPATHVISTGPSCIHGVTPPVLRRHPTRACILSGLQRHPDPVISFGSPSERSRAS